MQPGKDEKKKHECTECKRTFSTKSRLDTHLNTHTGEKPFLCDICGKNFSQSGNLTMHKRIHSEERPFKCNHKDCKYAAKTKFSLLSHVKRLHPHAIASDIITIPGKKAEKDHKCDKCGKNFLWLSHLTLHLISHEKIRPFSCAICRKTFKYKYQLNGHMKKVHPKEETASSSKNSQKLPSQSHNKISAAVSSETHDKSQNDQHEQSSEMAFLCDLCNFRTWSKEKWFMHKQRHADESKFKESAKISD
ncbi:zinc finger protein 429-like [Centruroides sculpturatus]|uniref:zinc finger protein 429-like n=1 Tax=Centruroides sculpturatus TaxID=218467 RepID=UPI000C6D0112|nr:zinc finger protein 429-like [Centruroides sculpturatus]